MGWYTMTFSLAAVIAPTLGGALYQYAQNLVWYLSLAAGVAVFVGFYALHARLRLTSAVQIVKGRLRRPTGRCR